MSTVKKFGPRFRVGDAASFLYGPRLVQGKIIENRGPLGAYGRRIYLLQATLGQEEATTFEVPEDALVAPAQAGEHEAAAGIRVEYGVTYTRPDGANRWSARVKRGRVHKGVKAQGAVAYTTGRWEGEGQEDEKHGIVSVLLEPRPHDTEQTLIAEAKRLSDRMFQERHPDAEIED